MLVDNVHDVNQHFLNSQVVFLLLRSEQIDPIIGLLDDPKYIKIIHTNYLAIL